MAMRTRWRICTREWISGRISRVPGRRPRVAWPRVAAFAGCLLPLGYIAWKFTADKLGANPIRELEIETGLWTLRLLAVTLAITPVRKATGWNALAKYRRM